MTEPPQALPNGLAPRLRRWGPLAVLVSVAALLYGSGAHRYLSLAAIAEHSEALSDAVDEHWLAAIAGYALIYLAVIAFSVPGGALLTILGGFLFGWFIAAPVTIAAATAGATIIFLIARSSFGDILSRGAGPRLRSVAEGLRSDSFYYLLFLRLVPAFPFWLVNIAPALVNVRLSTFVAATLLGIIPGTFAYALLGSGLDGIIAAQRAAYEACIAERGAGACEFSLDPGALLSGEVLAAFAALGIVALIPVILRRLKARRGEPTTRGPE